MLLNNRHGSVDSDAYRYGFQGQERDDEVKGEGNSYNYTYRMHDSRLGRFFATDPLESEYSFYTPYQFSGNKVIAFIELEGLEEFGAVAEEVITKTGTVLTNSYVNANGTTLALEGTEISLETAKNVHRFKWLKGAGKFLGLTMMMLSDTSSPNAASWNARQTVKSVDNLPGGTMTVTDVYSKGSEMPTEVTTYSLDRKLEVLPENMLSQKVQKMTKITNIFIEQ